MTTTRTRRQFALGAILSCRVSHDPKMKLRSVGQQEGELREWADDERWPVEGVLVESDVSASRFATPKAKRQREAWLRELAAELARPEVGRLLLWEPSRATRDVEFGLRIIKLCVANDVQIGYDGRLYDVSRARDRATVLRAFVDAEYEAGSTSERVGRDTSASALEGKPHGRLLYGYRRVYSDRTGELVRQEEDPAQAAVVRRVFADFLGGIAIRRIAHQLNAEGVPMPSAGKGRSRWYSVRIAQMLTNPGYAALRVHQGEVIGPAAWPALVPQATFDAVQAKLADRADAEPHSRAAKHLLSGIVRCGRCGGPMYRQVTSRGYAALVCAKGRGHLVRTYDPVEAWVLGLLITKLEAEDVELADAPADPETVAARAQVAELRRQLDEGRAAFDPNVHSMASFLFAEAELVKGIEAAQRRIKPARHVPTVLIDLLGPGALARWDALGAKPGGIDHQREVLRAVFAITVLPGVPGRHGFDKETVKVEPML